LHLTIFPRNKKVCNEFQPPQLLSLSIVLLNNKLWGCLEPNRSTLSRLDPSVGFALWPTMTVLYRCTDIATVTD